MPIAEKENRSSWAAVSIYTRLFFRILDFEGDSDLISKNYNASATKAQTYDQNQFNPSKSINPRNKPPSQSSYLENIP